MKKCVQTVLLFFFVYKMKKIVSGSDSVIDFLWLKGTNAVKHNLLLNNY